MGASEAADLRATSYTGFRILIDDPADDPVMGFCDYADALAEVVYDSPPRFAIGIFGSWGSGKTTLMRAIRSRIEDRDDVIPVWFNAWRYEREQHLIIPLLDVLRETLLMWPDEGGSATCRDKIVEKRAREAAAAMGAAARAIARGISLSARLPGGVAEAKLDLGSILSPGAASKLVGEPASSYHASFKMMAAALDGFIKAGGGNAQHGPQRRIVVFIDDLDRCLPLNALSVLESMKLFFDLDGFVFVAGLDQEVIARAIELRYADDRDHARAAAKPSDEVVEEDFAASVRLVTAPVSGRDYIKKIFQVPFGLPPMDRSRLGELVSALIGSAELPDRQVAELRGRILEHLRYHSDEGGVNAREVKRLINAYTLQAKLLSLKLDGKVDPDAILALQVMAFRPEWERICRRFESDPDGFANEVRQGLRERDCGEREGETVWVDGEPLPPRLVEYLDTGPGRTLLTNAKLKAYLSSSQASHTTNPSILRAQSLVHHLRRFMRDVNDGTDYAGLSASLHKKLDPLGATLKGAEWAGEVLPILLRLESDVSELTVDPKLVSIREWSDGFKARLGLLDNRLATIRDQHSLP